MKKSRILPSFAKGLRIWESIASNPEGMRLSDLSQQMLLPPSNITLYLNTLMSLDLLMRDPQTRKFFICPRAMELFRNAGENMIHKLLPCAKGPMESLHKKFNENVLLAIQKEDTYMYIKYISTNHIMRVGIEAEPEFSMHITASGRAILAFLPQKEIDRHIKKTSFVKLTEKTVDNEASLRKVLIDVHKKGYAFNAGEFESTVMAVAAPVIVNNRPIASLVVQFPTIRYSAEEAEEASAPIMKQAKAIETALNKTI